MTEKFKFVPIGELSLNDVFYVRRSGFPEHFSYYCGEMNELGMISYFRNPPSETDLRDATVFMNPNIPVIIEDKQ